MLRKAYQPALRVQKSERSACGRKLFSFTGGCVQRYADGTHCVAWNTRCTSECCSANADKRMYRHNDTDQHNNCGHVTQSASAVRCSCNKCVKLLAHLLPAHTKCCCERCATGGWMHTLLHAINMFNYRKRTLPKTPTIA